MPSAPQENRLAAKEPRWKYISYLTSLEWTELTVEKKIKNFVSSDLTPHCDKIEGPYFKKHCSKLYADSGKNHFPSQSADTL